MPNNKQIENKCYAIKTDSKTNSAELTLYGNIVKTRPLDIDTNDNGDWTLIKSKHNYIVGEEFLKDLDELGEIGKLNIRINSVGGDVHVALNIYSRLRQIAESGTELTCTVDGVAMSAGSMIMCAADRVRADESALIMIHSSMRLLDGYYNAAELQKLAQTQDEYDKAVCSCYKRKTGKSEDELLSLMSRETYMTGKEAKEIGFVDELISSENPVKIAACADRSALIVAGRIIDLLGAPCPENIPVITERREPPDINKNNNGGNVTMAKDLSELVKENPELAAKVQEELTEKISAEMTAKANESATTQIAAERKRLEEIDAVAHLFDEETVKAAKYGDKACSAQEMCYRAAQKAAESGSAFMANVKTDNGQSGVANVTSASGASNAATNSEEDVKAYGLSFMDSVLKPGKETE